MWRSLCWLVLGAVLPPRAAFAMQEQPVGSVRGVVYDDDFDVPLAGALVLIVETGQRAVTADQGNFAIQFVQPGRYTVVISKDGYVRQVKADVLVAAGALTDVDAALTGEFTNMEELIVQDVAQLGGGTEIGLLNLRLQSNVAMDSIGADLMSRAGASDAASALRLVAGTSVQDGKYAVVRGLPDRYVSSQMNGVRLPTADEDKRAVQFDQFPAAVIESIQVKKTFTPDQQGDASGGAVDVRLRGIPESSLLQLKGQYSWNSQVQNRDDFLTYDGGGVNLWGRKDRDIQRDNIGSNWDGAVGTMRDGAPVDHKWSLAAGTRHEVSDGIKIGGLASFFYERDSSYYDDGRNDSWWVTTPGGRLSPQYRQGTPQDGDFKTALFDVTQGKESVQWGSLLTLGVETDHHSVGLTYLYTRNAEDKATLAQDTRGKEYFFPGYVASRPTHPGNLPENLNAAPYIRTETLEYTERSTSTLQLFGRHDFTGGGEGSSEPWSLGAPILDWTLSHSTASLDQPDKRQFGGFWLPSSFNPGAPIFGVPPFLTPPTWFPYKPAANFNLGNVQRIWKSIDEESDQVSVNLEVPFEQWAGERGYVKVGLFDDHVTRKFDQDSFSNFGDAGSTFQGGFDQSWSAVFPLENHPITASNFDVDYEGDQKITAFYGMADLPLTSELNLIGGARFESTEIGIVNDPESLATWYPPGATAPVQLNAGDADVDFSQDDVLPSIGLAYKPTESVTVRASYSQTVARQTFKELTPILQQEFLGGPIFIGNPDLEMSALDNYDLRVDYAPYEGSLLSASYFYKRVDDPIEYVQRLTLFTFTTPVNYPKGELQGLELEARQSLGRLWDPLEGFSVGANATLIDSEVTLPDDEIAGFAEPNIQASIRSRDMTNAPEHLYNLFLTWDSEKTGTQIGLFYTIQGDTLVAGAGESVGNFVPSVYQREFDTLNLSVSQKLGSHFKLQLAAKNLTNPDIREVYRSPFQDDDVTKTSYSKGAEYALSLSAEFSF